MTAKAGKFRIVVDGDEFGIVYVIVGIYIIEHVRRRGVRRWKERCAEGGLRRNPARGNDIPWEGRLSYNRCSSGVQDPLRRIVNDCAIRRKVAIEVRWQGTLP